MRNVAAEEADNQTTSSSGGPLRIGKPVAGDPVSVGEKVRGAEFDRACYMCSGCVSGVEGRKEGACSQGGMVLLINRRRRARRHARLGGDA